MGTQLELAPAHRLPPAAPRTHTLPTQRRLEGYNNTSIRSVHLAQESSTLAHPAINNVHRFPWPTHHQPSHSAANINHSTISSKPRLTLPTFANAASTRPSPPALQPKSALLHLYPTQTFERSPTWPRLAHIRPPSHRMLDPQSPRTLSLPPTHRPCHPSSRPATRPATPAALISTPSSPSLTRIQEGTEHMRDTQPE